MFFPVASFRARRRFAALKPLNFGTGWIQSHTVASPLPSCVTWSRILPFSDPWFPLPQNEANGTIPKVVLRIKGSKLDDGHHLVDISKY